MLSHLFSTDTKIHAYDKMVLKWNMCLLDNYLYYNKYTNFVYDEKRTSVQKHRTKVIITTNNEWMGFVIKISRSHVPKATDTKRAAYPESKIFIFVLLVRSYRIPSEVYSAVHVSRFVGGIFCRTFAYLELSQFAFFVVKPSSALLNFLLLNRV